MIIKYKGAPTGAPFFAGQRYRASGQATFGGMAGLRLLLSAADPLAAANVGLDRLAESQYNLKSRRGVAQFG